MNAKKKIHTCSHAKINASKKVLSKTDRALLYYNTMFSVVSCKQREALTFNTSLCWAGHG